MCGAPFHSQHGINPLWQYRGDNWSRRFLNHTLGLSVFAFPTLWRIQPCVVVVRWPCWQFPLEKRMPLAVVEIQIRQSPVVPVEMFAPVVLGLRQWACLREGHRGNTSASHSASMIRLINS